MVGLGVSSREGRAGEGCMGILESRPDLDNKGAQNNPLDFNV